MFQEVNSLSIQQIAPAIGLKNPKGNMYSPCPCCGSEQRSDTDKRPPLGISNNGRGFQCHRCSAKGSLFDLICFARMQCRWQDAGRNERNNLKEFLQYNSFIPKTLTTNTNTRPQVKNIGTITSPPKKQVKVCWNT